MKMNIKLFIVAMPGFVAGFLLCLLSVVSPDGKVSTPLRTPVSTATLVEIPLQFTQQHSRRPEPAAVRTDLSPERNPGLMYDAELKRMRPQSLDLIDTRDRY